MAEPGTKAMFRDVIAQLAGSEGDLGPMEQALPALSAFVSEYATADFECVMRGMPPTPPVVHPGVEGLAKGWEDYGATFETVRPVLQEIHESDDHVVVLVNQIATTRHGGVEVTQPSAMVFAFDGDRVARVEFHLDQREALRVAGVEAD
jgi:ketosteroid isomerase-like protein